MKMMEKQIGYMLTKDQTTPYNHLKKTNSQLPYFRQLAICYTGIKQSRLT